MTITSITKPDLQLLNEFRPDGWKDIVKPFKYYIAKSFCRPVKLVLNDEIAGIGATIQFGNTAWLAHVIVRSGYRNQGIGTKIVGYLIEHLRNRTCESLSLITTDLGYPIYKKAGFVDQCDYVFFERKALFDPALAPSPAPAPAPAPAPDHLISTCVSHHEAIFGLDREASCEERRDLLKDYLAGSLVYEKDRLVRGFFLPALGDGLIVADNYEAGISLMKQRLMSMSNCAIPAGNRKGELFLLDEGFKETRRARRMTMGPEFPWKPDWFYNRIAGNLG
jgi:GNAT superfamily N-acetyltransferase